jgi:hypothetical protein
MRILFQINKERERGDGGDDQEAGETDHGSKIRHEQSEKWN